MVAVNTKLIVELEESETVYKKDPKQGVTKTLMAIISHLELLAVPPNLSEPLFMLVMALDDAEQGTKNPLLDVRKLNHRAPIMIAERQARAHAAAALEILISPDFDLHQAASKVAKVVRNWPWSATKRVNARALLKWRERVQSGLDGDDFDTTTFHALVKYAKDSPMDNETIAASLLKDVPWMR